jgi:hypothetical protein
VFPVTKRVLLALFASFGVLAVLGVAHSAPAPKEPPSVKTPEGGIEATPVDATGDEADRLERISSNNLKQIALAVHNYIDVNNGKFPGDITGKDGKPLLSWRVHLLPYIEADNLYKQFKLDEPWDSEHNKKLLAQMPKVFASPRVKVKEGGHTTYLGFAGPGSAFEPGKELQLPASFTDGTSNTILAVESSTAYPWTRPIDLPFDPKAELPAFGKAYGNKPLCALCDGSTRILDLSKISGVTLKAAITTAGGEVLGTDW